MVITPQGVLKLRVTALTVKIQSLSRSKTMFKFRLTHGPSEISSDSSHSALVLLSATNSHGTLLEEFKEMMTPGVPVESTMWSHSLVTTQDQQIPKRLRPRLCHSAEGDGTRTSQSADMRASMCGETDTAAKTLRDRWCHLTLSG